MIKTEEFLTADFFEVNEKGELMYNNGKGKSFHNINSLVLINDQVCPLVDTIDGMIFFRIVPVIPVINAPEEDDEESKAGQNYIPAPAVYVPVNEHSDQDDNINETTQQEQPQKDKSITIDMIHFLYGLAIALLVAAIISLR